MKHVNRMAVGLLLILGIGFMVVNNGQGIVAKSSEPIKLYQQGTSLYFQVNGVEKVLLEDVIDYKLTCLEASTQSLIVLHLERSSDIDQHGYDLAKENGLLVGGYVRFYDIVVEDQVMALKQFYEKDFTRVNPWSIEAGHLDDNELLDVFVGAYRATDYYEAARRPFVLEWTGEYLTRKWTGSALNTLTFSKVIFEDLENDGIEELVAYQYDTKLGPVKRYFKWGHFVFDQVETKVIE